VLPLQAPALTTTEARKNDFHLVAALSEEGTAIGTLYQDAGDSYDFESNSEYTKTLFHVGEGRTSGYFQANVR
jgi:hypothetical protein